MNDTSLSSFKSTSQRHLVLFSHNQVTCHLLTFLWPLFFSSSSSFISSSLHTLPSSISDSFTYYWFLDPLLKLSAPIDNDLAHLDTGSSRCMLLTMYFACQMCGLRILFTLLNNFNNKNNLCCITKWKSDISVHKALLRHSHTHYFIYYLWLLLDDKSIYQWIIAINHMVS